jgi:DNA-binding NarL/FixJ family response regulator
MSIKVLLADDNAIVRRTILGLLKDEPRIEIAGEATCFAETLQRTAALNPDVVLIDLQMKDKREYPPEVVKPQILLGTQRNPIQPVAAQTSVNIR